MFVHVKELQFDARVSKPDPRFAALLLEQFGGGNGELKAAMQYFTQAFSARRPYPDKYDLLMDIATEEFSHLEIVGATITMLLDGVNSELKDAASVNPIVGLKDGGVSAKHELIQAAMVEPQFLSLTGGGVNVTNSQGIPWSGAYVNANGDLTVDLRSDMAAECRAKIVYEYLLKFTDDPHVRETLRFLMIREIAHFQMFGAALETIKPNFPPGVLQGDRRLSHAYFNMSGGGDARGPWNEGQGPWPEGEQWSYIKDPVQAVVQTKGGTEIGADEAKGASDGIKKFEAKLSKQRSTEAKAGMGNGTQQWSAYPQNEIAAPGTDPGV